MQQVDLRTSRHPLARIAPARDVEYATDGDAGNSAAISGVVVWPLSADSKCHADQSLLSPIDNAPPLHQLRAGQYPSLRGRWGLDRLPRAPEPDPFVAPRAGRKRRLSACPGSRF